MNPHNTVIMLTNDDKTSISFLLLWNTRLCVKTKDFFLINIYIYYYKNDLGWLLDGRFYIRSKLFCPMKNRSKTWINFRQGHSCGRELEALEFHFGRCQRLTDQVETEQSRNTWGSTQQLYSSITRWYAMKRFRNQYKQTNKKKATYVCVISQRNELLTDSE